MCKVRNVSFILETRFCFTKIWNITEIGWYWPQGLLSMQIDNIHKSWVTTFWHNTGQLYQQIRIPHVLARDPWVVQLSL
jgi:hypothetical protein